MDRIDAFTPRLAAARRTWTPARSIALVPNVDVGDSHAALSKVYVGIALSNPSTPTGERDAVVVVTDGHSTLRSERSTCPPRIAVDVLLSDLLDKLEQYAQARGHKIEVVALSADAPSLAQGHSLSPEPFASFYDRVWLALDALPFLISPALSPAKFSLEGQAVAAVEQACTCLEPSQSTTVRIEFDPQRKVLVDADHRIHLGSLRVVERVSSPRLFSCFRTWSRTLARDRVRIGFFSATPRGGGVALMRHALVRLWHQVGLDARWYVPPGDPNVFNVTKRKFHNVLQGVAPTTTFLTQEDKDLYEKWTNWYFETLWKDASGDGSEFLDGFDVIVIDDPQVLGLVPLIRKLAPRTKLVYRSHIQIRADLIDQGADQQRETWDYLFKWIRQVDLFVAHPVEQFVPKVVKNTLPVVYMPPCTASLDGLNKPIPSRYVATYRRTFNLAAEMALGRKLDWDRGYILQIARFDPSKGIPDLVEGYRLFRIAFSQDLRFVDRVPPQLVLTGHSAIDDPDGARVLKALYDQLSSPVFDSIRTDVFAVRAPPSDRLLDTVLRCADVVCQVSVREGYEIKVTEAVAKNKWVVVTNAGGLPLQVRGDGIDGRIVEPNDPRGISQALIEFYASNLARVHCPDDDSDETISALIDRGSPNFSVRRGDDDDEDGNVDDAERHSTVANAAMWEYLFLRLVSNSSNDRRSRPTADERGDEDEQSKRFGIDDAEGEGLESLNGKRVWEVIKGFM